MSIKNVGKNVGLRVFYVPVYIYVDRNKDFYANFMLCDFYFVFLEYISI